MKLLLLLFALASLLPTRAHGADSEAEVLVYGSTPGGFCAAIAAAREGATVILLEPTGHVGGVNTGGLCFSDSNQTARSTLMGLFDEWHRRLEQDYQARGVALPYRVSEKDQKPWTYEPGVAARITGQMLAEAKVRVVTGARLQAVTKDGPRITQLATAGGTSTAKTFIDASYEGDLMAAAGVSWTIGREGSKAHGESLAGRQYPKPTLPISGYDAAGAMLPLITTADAGPEEEGDRHVMTYSFRLCLTQDPANRVPFPAPAHYDPARFEVIRRYYQEAKGAEFLWDLYPLPGGKVDANNGIAKPFSMGLIGAGDGWCEADTEGRAKLWEAHKQYTLEMYHFLTTDPAVPEALRRKLAAYGLCRDEFPEHGHWSPQLYVREGRRLRGLHVLTQSDIQQHPEKTDSIAVSSFPMDSHDCQRIALPGGGVRNEGTIFPAYPPGLRHGPAYQVPFRSLLPQPAECVNLLVPVALSSTHVAYSSLRVEPTWMVLGQSAGIAAALAVKMGVTVQALPYPALRERLLAQGQVLDLPAPPAPPQAPKAGPVDPATLPGIVLDDSQAEVGGHWSRSATFSPHIGAGYLHDDRRGDGQSVATFRLRVPRSARYALRIAYSPHPTRAAKIPVLVQCGARTTRLEFDQTQPLPAGEAFRSASEIELSSEHETTITLSNTGTTGFVILDAIQLLEVKLPLLPARSGHSLKSALAATSGPN